MGWWVFSHCFSCLVKQAKLHTSHAGPTWQTAVVTERTSHDSFSILKTSNLVVEIETYFSSALPSSYKLSSSRSQNTSDSL